MELIFFSYFQIYSWDINKFNHYLPKGHWDDFLHQQQFIQTLSSELHITTPDEWLNLTFDTLKVHGGLQLLAKYGSIGTLLSHLVPSYQDYCKQSLITIVERLKIRIEDIVHLSPR